MGKRHECNNGWQRWHWGRKSRRWRHTAQRSVFDLQLERIGFKKFSASITWSVREVTTQPPASETTHTGTQTTPDTAQTWSRNRKERIQKHGRCQCCSKHVRKGHRNKRTTKP